MALQTAQGALVMVGLNTASPKIFWNGEEVTGISGIKVEWSPKEQEIKLRVDGNDDADYMALVSAGISVKKEKK